MRVLNIFKTKQNIYIFTFFSSFLLGELHDTCCHFWWDFFLFLQQKSYSQISFVPRPRTTIICVRIECTRQTSFFFNLEKDWPENIRLQGGKYTVIYYVSFLNTHSGPQLPGNTIWENGKFFYTVSTFCTCNGYFTAHTS